MNTYIVENYELVRSAKKSDIPAVIIISNGYSSISRCYNTLEVGALTLTTSGDAQAVMDVATGVFKAGASVIVAGGLAPSVANEARAVVQVSGDAIDEDDLADLEKDGIFRIVVTDTTPTWGTNVTDKDKSRFALYDHTTLISSAQTHDDELMGFIAGQICKGYYEDSALPYNNIAVDNIIGADDIVYKTNTELNTLFHANKIAFYNVNGRPCLFGIPTLATYNLTSLWFDLTVRQTTDFVADAIITTLKDKYPRTKRNQEVLTSIKASTISVLENLQNREIIENENTDDVVVMTDGTRDGLIIAYTLDVVTPLYIVTIKQSVTLGDMNIITG